MWMKKARTASSWIGGLAMWGLWAWPAVVHAQAADARTLDTVRVLGSTQPLSAFPGAVTIIDGEALRAGQRRVDLSETLSQVPGLTVRDRQNHAQDLQIQSRGFGARSTFGIRGLRLVVDGVPASATDGQGQAANFALDTLDRIEVLRGPLALQVGNAAGGAIVGYSELEGAAFRAIDGWAGSRDSHRVGARVQGGQIDAAWRWRAHGSHFATAGERVHSRARRQQAGLVIDGTPAERRRLRLVVDGLHQPHTQDPLGLTREAWQRDPYTTDPVALRFDTRKRIDQRQWGLRWEDNRHDRRRWWLSGHGIDREIEQFLAIPVAAQSAPGSAGGVIDLQRQSSGGEAGHRWQGARGALALGLEWSRTDEARRGYENFVGEQLGVRGRLRRDESNRIEAREAFAVGELRSGPRWNWLGGMRASRLNFRSADHYIAPGNGDDSGALTYREWAASAGLSRMFATGEVFASVGRGFETPTMTELAYAPDGNAGLNRALQSAQHRSLEIGARHRRAGGRWSLAPYRIEGRNEIVPADSRGGRASFTNAGQTRRQGIELGLDGDFAEAWDYQFSINALQATFAESFRYQVNGAAREVPAGNHLPGVPALDGQLTLRRQINEQWQAAVETRGSRRVWVDDRNSDAAPGYVRVGVRLLWRRGGSSGWHGFVRMDNVFGHEHVGSVIVNEGNGRYFEPAAGRVVTVGLGWNDSQ